MVAYISVNGENSHAVVAKSLSEAIHRAEIHIAAYLAPKEQAGATKSRAKKAAKAVSQIFKTTN
jgi:hypothetical protein